MKAEYNRPIELAEGVHWVGFADAESGLHCNPYLIIAGEEAVLIDGGSRPDFSKVMMKILGTGVEPRQISTLIYQHYDPDLCGSIPNLEDIIGRDDLRIVSHRENNIFIRHYAVRSRLRCVEEMGLRLTLRNGRALRFFLTPYSHSAGSFVTLDESSGTLFTSDLFGTYGTGSEWNLFADIDPRCHGCANSGPRGTAPGSRYECSKVRGSCFLPGILNFHRRVMTSSKALKHAVRTIQATDPQVVAPQHGSVIKGSESIGMIGGHLAALDDIGIDGIAEAGLG